MKPHKHPPIFVKILAITFVFWIISGVVAGYAFLAFFTPGPLSDVYWEFTKLQWQWLLSEVFGMKPTYTGVDPQYFVERDFGWWATLARNLYSTINHLSDLVSRSELYYIRKAEYYAYRYIDYEEPREDKIMAPIISELCKIQRGVYINIEGLINQAKEMQDSYGGDLSGYYIFLEYHENDVRHYYLITKVSYELVYVAEGEGWVWNCNGWDLEPAQVGRAYDLYNYLVLAPGHVEITFKGHKAEAIGVLTGVSNALDDGELLGPYLYVISRHYFDSPEEDENELYPALNNYYAKIQQIYSKAWSFAKIYHECLRNMGYSNPQEVPASMLPPPVDVAFYSLDKLIEENVPLEEIVLSYNCLLYTSPSPRDRTRSRMPSSA